jgi:membrane protease YdiL (CAAX protease family)
MKSGSLDGTVRSRSPLIFFLLVFALSIPIWVIGPIVDQLLPEGMAINLPTSALMFVAPASAALILVRKQEGSEAAKKLLKRAFGFRKIKMAWYVPILLFWPAMMLLQFGLVKLMGLPVPDPQVPVLMIPVSFVIFFMAALGEEVGWQGYAVGPLQERWSALAASIILGIVWATWHIVPLIQTNQPPAWIVWQYMSIAVTRILIVWLYNSTGRSVFAAILFHAMNNVSTVLLPSYGWPYDPFVGFAIVATSAVIITFLWGPKTLAQYRYVHPGRDVQAHIVN